MWCKGHENKKGAIEDEKVQTVASKLEESQSQIQSGELKLQQGEDAMTLMFDKERGSALKGVGPGVTRNRYFNVPRAKPSSSNEVKHLNAKLAHEREENEKKEAKIQALFADMQEYKNTLNSVLAHLQAQGMSIPTGSKIRQDGSPVNKNTNLPLNAPVTPVIPSDKNVVPKISKGQRKETSSKIVQLKSVNSSIDDSHPKSPQTQPATTTRAIDKTSSKKVQFKSVNSSIDDSHPKSPQTQPAATTRAIDKTSSKKVQSKSVNSSIDGSHPKSPQTQPAATTNKTSSKKVQSKSVNSSIDDSHPKSPQTQPATTTRTFKCSLSHAQLRNIVAVGTVHITKEKQTVHGVPLQDDCHKVSIDKVVKENAFLPYATYEHKLVGEAVGSFVAWPKHMVKFLEEETSLTSTENGDGEKKNANGEKTNADLEMNIGDFKKPKKRKGVNTTDAAVNQTRSNNKQLK